MLSTTKNFLFIHIPKTAGNSLQSVLQEYSDDKLVCLTPYQDGIERFEIRSEMYQTTKHSTLAEYQSQYGEALLKQLYKFTTVRNPWERAISFYFSPHRGQVEWNEQAFAQFVETIKPIVHYIALSEGQTLAAAIKNLDGIIRFEHLSADYSKISNMLGLGDHPLPVRNQSNRMDYRQYYTPELEALVRERFYEETAVFGYRF